MKTLLLYLVAPPVIAQTLTPALVATSDGVSVWILVAGMAVAFVLGLFVGRKVPQAATAIETEFEKLLAMLRTHTDAAKVQAEAAKVNADAHAVLIDTTAKLAEVVVLPPMQESINAQPGKMPWDH